MACFLFITLYNESDIGSRQLVANLRAEGHEAYLLCLKLARTRVLESFDEWDPMWQVSIEPDGRLRCLSYPNALTACEIDLLESLLDRLSPDVVGLSVYTAFLPQAREVTAHVRRARPSAIVIWGGPHVTLDPAASAEFCDIAFVGECDEPIIEFARRLDRREDWRSSPNIAWKEQGKLHRQPVSPVVKDLDALPYPYWGFDGIYYLDEDELLEGRPHPWSELNTYYKILTTRGCPYVCTYCMPALTKKVMPDASRLRFRSIEHCMRELEEAKRLLGNYYLEIEDDIFTVRLDRMRAFFEQYRKRIGLPFGCQTHPNFAKPEMLQILKENHAEFVAMGIQSGSNRILNEVYDRRVFNAAVLQAAHNIHESGIRAFYDIISNNPFETEEDCRATFDLLRQLPKPYEMRMGVLILYPNMPIWEKRVEAGLPERPDFQWFRFWNAMYYLASTVDLTDAEAEYLLTNSELRRDPALLETIAATTVRLTREKHDAQTLAANHLREVHRLVALVRELEGELHYIKARRGLRQFLWLSDHLRGLKRGVSRKLEQWIKRLHLGQSPREARGQEPPAIGRPTGRVMATTVRSCPES